MLTSPVRGSDFCEKCGLEVMWIRLLSGSWIAVDPEPVLYIPDEGKRWLIEGRRWDAVFIKGAKIYKPFSGMDRSKVERGYMPHAWICDGR